MLEDERTAKLSILLVTMTQKMNDFPQWFQSLF